MSLRHVLAFVSATTAIAALAATGCNVVLGNEEGTLRVTADSGAGPGTTLAEAGAELTCDTNGNKPCFGLCVRTDQVTTGCGDASSCVACDPKNAKSPICKGTANGFECAFDECSDGFASCDGIGSNGCEASLNRAETCGSCTTKCEGATPLCAPMAGSYGCTDTCPKDTAQCGSDCVDIDESIENCGGCGKKCARPSADARCQDGECRFECKSGTHECNDACVPDADPATCGSRCSSCPTAGPHTEAVCTDGACAIKCETGWSDCNGNLVDDGCEQKNGCLNAAPCGTLTCVGNLLCCSGSCSLTCALDVIFPKSAGSPGGVP